MKYLFLTLFVLFLSGCAAGEAPEAAANFDSLPEPQALAAMEDSVSTEDAADDFSVYHYESDDLQAEPFQVFADQPPMGKGIPEASSPGTVYSVFHFENLHQQAPDGTEILTGQAADTVVFTGSQATDQWISKALASGPQQEQALHLEALLLQAEAAYEKVPEGERFYPHSCYYHAETTRQDPDLLSLVFTSSANIGENQPVLQKTAYNYDLKSQNRLNLTDVILPEQFDVFAEQAIQLVQKQMEILSKNGINTEYSEDFITDNWYFTGTGLAIFCDSSIQLEIPYPALRGILRPAYFPMENPHIGEENVQILENPQADKRIPLYLSDASAEETREFGFSGPVYEVSISSVYGWIQDGIPLLTDDFFSANYLDCQTSIELIGSPSEAEAYCVRFSDGLGRQYRYVINREHIEQLRTSAE